MVKDCSTGISKILVLNLSTEHTTYALTLLWKQLLATGCGQKEIADLWWEMHPCLKSKYASM